MTETRYRVEILDTGEAYDCRGEQSLLKAMQSLGRKGIPVGCRAGGCGVCKIRIEAGEVAYQVMSRAHVTEAEQAAGYALACRCSPRSDIRLSVVGKMQKTVCRQAATE